MNTNNFATHEDIDSLKQYFSDSIDSLKRDLKNESEKMELRLSRELSRDTKDAFWKLVPLTLTITIGFAGLTAGAVYFMVNRALEAAVKISMGL